MNQRSGSTAEVVQRVICDDRRFLNIYIYNNKKLLETSASLLVTSALLVVTRSYWKQVHIYIYIFISVINQAMVGDTCPILITLQRICREIDAGTLSVPALF